MAPGVKGRPAKNAEERETQEEDDAEKLSQHGGGKLSWQDHELQELEFGNMLGRAWAAATLGVYMKTMYPTVAGGDTGQLMGTACELGVAHPPGYPLFTMISWLGIQIIPVGNPAYRLNVVTVLFATLASWLLFHAVLLWHLGLMRNESHDKWRGSAWVALLASALFTFCPLVWKYSTHAEVFAMNNMFIALLQYLCVRFVQDRDVKWARLGAFSIGLGLSNQHTLVLYALPLVGWMLWIGRKELFTLSELILLPLLGLLGMTPYLYLFWAATNAPLGSWGDTSTLSGWPAVGFWTHFLRTEFGTFALYAGEDGKTLPLSASAEAYARNAVSNMLMMAWAAPLGVFSSFRREGAVSFGAVSLSSLLFYLLVFHSLANLPVDASPVYRGIQMRFWMQPHALLVGFVAVGAEALLALLSLWRRAPAILLVCALSVLQIASNLEAMDQSANWHTFELGRRILDRVEPGAILLVKSDLLTNAVRFQLRCEKHRRDVAHLDMLLMPAEWYKTMQGSHFPGGIEFPGVQFSVNGVKRKVHRSCCPYSMRQFLDANLVDGGRPMYILGGWVASENPEGQPVGIPGYQTEPVGYGSRIVRLPGNVADDDFQNCVNNFTLPEDLPDQNRYDPTTWESAIFSTYIGFAQALHVRRIHRAVARGKEEAEGSPWIKDQAELESAISELEKVLSVVESSPAATEAAGDAGVELYRNLGIAHGRRKCAQPKLFPKVDCPGQTKMREYMRKFLAVTTKSKKQLATEQLIVDNPDKFINLANAS